MNAAKMRIGGVLVLALATALASGGRAAPPAAPAVPPGAAPIAPPPPGAQPPAAGVLVVNELLLQDLMDIDRLAKRKMYSDAIEICQRMLDQPNLGLATTVDKGLMMSARVAANEKLAAMGPEALAVYRTLHEPQARALYERATAAGDPGLLHELTWRYIHTEHGLKGLSALGALHFDRGQFVTAAYYWRRLLEAAPEEGSRAELLARLAAAYHLGGEESMARAAADELKAKYPRAKAVFGGREQNLVEFAAGVMAMPIPGGAGAEGGWPGIGAVPGVARAMQDCPASLNRHWTDANAASLAATQPSARALLALGEWLRYADGVSLLDGQVQLGARAPVAGMIHLASAGGAVLCRDDDGVAAIDPATGKTLWRREIPLVRRLKELEDLLVPGVIRPARKMPMPTHTEVVEGNKVEAPAGEISIPERRGVPFFRYGFSAFCDAWQYSLTVGDGKAYVVAGFVPQSVFLDQVTRQEPNLAGKVKDDSCLAALSIAEEGKVLWTIGQGRGDDEVVRKGKFLSPPAYRDGRLYAVALHNADYYLLCLSAGDGSLTWKSSAVAGGARDVRAIGGGGEVSYRVRDWCAPPTLWGDRLFLVTTGAVSAYDTHTGDLAWAYQYPVREVRTDDPRGAADRARPHYNVSPLVVSSQRVLCAPSDSEVVFALAEATGRPLWLRDREGHMDLTAVDGNSVLLSGFDPQERLKPPDANEADARKKLEAELMQDPQKNRAILEVIRRQTAPPKRAALGTMMLLDAVTGEPLYKAPADCLAVGRPAVTAKEVVASGFGKVYRLRLADRTLAAVEVKDASAILGNLVVIGGRLYAANACGISAYGGK